ncbi:MAG: sigma-70 family RNA polymerase sigma factor [Imperialibacter sp.]|uniref:RNA polymerase sigma factor n=1 Tax=Imperialibacter sp. TaxID=2038411 RepID=UPI0032EE0424
MTEELVKKCIKSDRKAQEAFFDHFKRQVMGVCVRYAVDEEEAKDIFQDAFVKIFLHLKKVRDVVALPAWVKQVAVTTAINHFHKTKKHKYDTDLEGIVETASDDHRMLVQQIDNNTLVELVNTLPAGYKMVFNLYVVEGYTHPEIAEKLKISENTSKSQLSRAKAMLRTLLEKKGIKSLTNYA